MFDKLKLTDWLLEDFGSELGIVKANLPSLKLNNYAPIIKKEQKTYEIVQIGKVNYDYLDNFIMESMNDIYYKLHEGSNEERTIKVENYKNLYEIWENINEAKEKNSPYLDELYNDLVYALHTLGYNKK